MSGGPELERRASLSKSVKSVGFSKTSAAEGLGHEGEGGHPEVREGEGGDVGKTRGKWGVGKMRGGRGGGSYRGEGGRSGGGREGGGVHWDEGLGK